MISNLKSIALLRFSISYLNKRQSQIDTNLDQHLSHSMYLIWILSPANHNYNKNNQENICFYTVYCAMLYQARSLLSPGVRLSVCPSARLSV